MSAGQRTAAHVVRPPGLDLCWVPNPAAPSRCCTLRPGHADDHFHEYSGTRWQQRASDLSGRPQLLTSDALMYR